ncbi:YheT family hydrolase [Croceitalea rosinachiae]|uniref:Alpha/beta fold hydrolase n=1 Tax=Croceitalea rosinachiae TaxID=3075596 RepID=A0ABU3A8M7_9FLAO|nr:alpha/beta fold hydrolase [Croceitalea sp. F388]MDT0606536.1 alpha/beta fold hydrolase [Croceitalea sp. F388]
MPLVPSNYRPPFPFRNGHFSTIYSGVFRKIRGLVQHRERINLYDGDFLDLDWSESSLPSNKVVILVHGLEGDAQRHYITGSAKKLTQNRFDTCAINLRGCSGEPNKLYRSYHSGATEDLISVIDHILSTKKYQEIYLLGFSLGGNLILKYLGEGNEIPHQVKAAVGVSVPCSLKSACDELLNSKNVLYSARFKKHLLAKLRQKQQRFPNNILSTEIASIGTLKDFDDIYTSRAHGFKDALDYYEKCSCDQFLGKVGLPSLILNAKNDSFLGDDCYPYEQAETNSNVYLEVPDFGGHVGFWGKQNTSYAEERALQFFNDPLIGK